MTRRELNLAIFEGTANKVLWQPRLETWIAHHRTHGTLPDRFGYMDNLRIYDTLHCSVRYVYSANLATAGNSGIAWVPATDGVEESSEEQGEHTVHRVRTFSGEITTVYHNVWEGARKVNCRIERYPVKTPRDLDVVIDLVNRQRFRVDPRAYSDAADTTGQRGEPTLFLTSSGFTELVKNWCGMEETFYLYHDYPGKVEEYLEACDRRDDQMIDEALKLPCRIFNLGDHATNEFSPPPILKKYLLPRWQRIAKRLHGAGRFVHSHWDGNSRHILPFLLDSGLDAVEALTPEPMGDMTLEQIKAAVQDKMVVLDLIPAIDFLPSRPLREVLDFTRKVIDMFAPRLILGISDEISQVGQIEKVEAISKLVDDICGLAE